MQNLTISTIQDGNIEPCRALYNELMQFQKSKAYMGKERFDEANFDASMRPACEKAIDNQVILVRDNDIPIGYAFSTITSTDIMRKSSFPGLLPEWDNFPQKLAHLDKLFVKEEYRGSGLGSRLFEMSMKWMAGFSDVNLIFIHVSNGNNDTYNFYLKYGFIFSQDVLDGFIKAVYKYQ